MQHFFCKTCGVQYPLSEAPPDRCPICEDERQFVGDNGQEWLTYQELRDTHANDIRPLAPNLTGIGIKPGFAINQRALLVQTAQGNVLWDCTPLVEDETIDRVNELGGVTAVAVSHPHYYSNMATWSQTFDVPIYIHEKDKDWVMEPHDSIVYWQGNTFSLNDDLTLIRCGGHFEGGQVLHWRSGEHGKGALLAGDILNVTRDRRYVSFMYSYPNLIPLSPSKIQHIISVLEPFSYDRVYSAWFETVSTGNAKANVAFSAQRYINAITD